MLGVLLGLTLLLMCSLLFIIGSKPKDPLKRISKDTLEAGLAVFGNKADLREWLMARHNKTKQTRVEYFTDLELRKKLIEMYLGIKK